MIFLKLSYRAFCKVGPPTSILLLPWAPPRVSQLSGFHLVSNSKWLVPGGLCSEAKGFTMTS